MVNKFSDKLSLLPEIHLEKDDARNDDSFEGSENEIYDVTNSANNLTNGNKFSLNYFGNISNFATTELNSKKILSRSRTSTKTNLQNDLSSTIASTKNNLAFNHLEKNKTNSTSFGNLNELKAATKRNIHYVDKLLDKNQSDTKCSRAFKYLLLNLTFFVNVLIYIMIYIFFLEFKFNYKKIN
jgi:hypothetical protein